MSNQFTKAQLFEAYFDNEWADEDPADYLPDIPRELAEIEFHKGIADGEAVRVLEALDIEDAEDRVWWFNVASVNSDNLLLLANMDFSVNLCDVCDGTMLHGPGGYEFYGARQDKGAEIEILGKSKWVCGHCLANNPLFL